MMEAARTSETLVNFYQTTRRYNLEDSHLRPHRRENLKSYLKIIWTESVLAYIKVLRLQGRIAGLQAKIWNCDLPNTKQEL
jgi:hypothetical protein